MQKSVVIVGGGAGKRMNSDIPKQFLLLKGKPMLMQTISRFLLYDPDIRLILVLPENYFPLWQDLCDQYQFHHKIQLVAGGKERFYSVKNALEYVSGLIAVHDAVRPLVSEMAIGKAFSLAAEKGNAVPVIPANESLRIQHEEGNQPLDRSKVLVVQTPQVFRYELLKEAYKQKFKPEFTDDATVVESLGHKIFTTDGNPENIKITTPMDMKLAELYLSDPRFD
jgi:2-C-methyl-D-erythritol 4-phosphate cytidylyltransferase